MVTALPRNDTVIEIHRSWVSALKKRKYQYKRLVL